MDIQLMTRFFMWCTIINGGLLLLWGSFVMLMPGLVYRTQAAFFPIPREQFTVVIYCFLGLHKIFFIIFNVVPFVALTIIG